MNIRDLMLQCLFFTVFSCIYSVWRYDVPLGKLWIIVLTANITSILLNYIFYLIFKRSRR